MSTWTIQRNRSARALGLLFSLVACKGRAPAEPVVAPAAAPPVEEPLERPPPRPFAPRSDEVHLADLRQLSFGGENAEAYWSMDGKRLSLQARYGKMGCDRIYTMDVTQGLPSLTPVSSGQGATTCSFYLPGDQELIWASTHGGGPDCPPKPDMSQGYVWALYPSYDIYRSRADGSELVRLTDTTGYDAEGTVCKKDGSIVFTSVRDGDLELYRMDKDGKNVRRLTTTPGYDGGAFFSDDCKKIVWRASRPAAGNELEDYRRLLAQGLVRPSKLELYVANADGSDPTQVTYLNAASFGPYFFPDGQRIIFSSNYGDPKGRDFDLWTVRVDGTGLTRVTTAPGFDGFPMFSPDGQALIFASNRANAPGAHDTNLFLARWVEAAPGPEDSPAARVRADVAWLADDAREGRGVGTRGLEEAGAFLEKRLQELGLEPAGSQGFRFGFPVTTEVTPDPKTRLVINGKALEPKQYRVLGYSAEGTATGPLVLARYGIVDAGLKVDHYAGLNVKGKIVVVRRFVPEGEPFLSTEAKRRFGDLRYKAWLAKERGAKALLVVDHPEVRTATAAVPDQAALPALEPEGPGDAGIPVLVVDRAVLAGLVGPVPLKTPFRAELAVKLVRKQVDAFNVVARLPGKGRPGPVIIGAHYDHLGFGGRHSLTPDRHEPHVGADDNASGTAALLEAARLLAARKAELERDVLFMAFSGEESGVLGSTFLVRQAPPALGLKEAIAMLNMDMVGRLRGNNLSALGGESAKEWPELVGAACAAARVSCTADGDGYGPSDHTPFYATGMPVLHFFTGAHDDYHKPSDRVERLNAAGNAKVAEVVAGLAAALSRRTEKLTFVNLPSPAPRGDLRSFNASLGTVPDYVGQPGVPGMLLAGVRPGGAAEKAGMQRGDVIVQLGKHAIKSVEDLMYVLNASKPGETVRAAVIRGGQRVEMEVTFQESRRPR